MSDPAGREIVGYRIDAEIGRGGRAVVHRATQLARQRTVALKVVPGDAAERARIVREGTAAAAIDHPHVLPVYDAGESGGHAFIAMRLVDGSSLEELARAPGGVEARRALAILRQVAEALDHLAGRGTAHGDVRAGGVLVGPGDHAYLAGAGTGAVEPLAPEQAAGAPATATADRYALAAMAMELLTGAPRRPRARAPAPRARIRRPAALR
jgi:serine/threonine protein kinase